MDSLVRAELRRICERWEEADRRFLDAKARAEQGELSQAELDRWEAQGDYLGCSQALADLFVLMFRHSIKYQPDRLRSMLFEMLAPELHELWEDLLRLQRRRA